MGKNGHGGVIRSIQQELQPKNLLPGLVTGIVAGPIELIFFVSLVSVTFSGELASEIDYRIGIALVSAAVMLIVTALTFLFNTVSEESGWRD